MLHGLHGIRGFPRANGFWRGTPRRSSQFVEWLVDIFPYFVKVSFRGNRHGKTLTLAILSPKQSVCCLFLSTRYTSEISSGDVGLFFLQLDHKPIVQEPYYLKFEGMKDLRTIQLRFRQSNGSCGSPRDFRVGTDEFKRKPLPGIADPSTSPEISWKSYRFEERSLVCHEVFKDHS